MYVDSQIAYALPLAGGTLSGALTLPGDPTATLQAATKQYVDTRRNGVTEDRWHSIRHPDLDR